MQDPTQTKSGYLRFPPEGETEDLKAYRLRFFNREANYRNQYLERATRNQFYKLGQHYGAGQDSYGLEANSGYSLQFDAAIGGPTVNMPRPYINLVAHAVSGAAASLDKRKLTPKVIPSSTDPKVEAAAKEATHILKDRMRRLEWDSIRRTATDQFIVTGVGVVKSYWDESHLDTVRIGSDSAVGCPTCPGMVLAEPSIPTQMDDETVIDQPIEACPECGGELQPYPVSQEEANDAEDGYGRPMGSDAPKGQTALEVVNLWELYLENSGIGTSPSKIRTWGTKTARSLDWIEERYPEFADKLVPDSPGELMQDHPLLGDRRALQTYSADLDTNIYEGYLFVYEMVQDRSYRFPEGRYVCMVEHMDEPLYDGPLYFSKQEEGKTVSVPRVKFHTALWEERVGEFYAKSHVDDLISPQNILNSRMAATLEADDRMGSPNIICPDEVWLAGPEWHQDWGSGRILRYEISPMNPNAKPEVIQGQGVAGSTWRITEFVIDIMRQLGGPPPMMQGEAPKNITTTSGLQIINEGEDALRKPQVDALIAMYESIWRHQLDMLAILRTEGDEDFYEIETDADTWEKKQFSSENIAGQTKVKIEREPFIAQSVYMKEAIREAQMDGLYNKNHPELSPYTRIRLLEERGLPTDPVDDEYNQVKVARRKWFNFLESGIVPVIDETLDDASIHFEVLGNFLNDGKGLELSEAARWPELSRQIANWKFKFMALYQNDQAARAFYGGIPANPEMAFQQAMMEFEGQMQGWQEQQAAVADVAMQEEQTGIPKESLLAEPPQPPPMPTFLPNALQDKIMAVWQQLLAELGGMAPDGTPQPNLPPAEGADMDPDAAATSQQEFLQFRAVVEAYKIMADEQLMAELMGAPGTPAPSSEDNVGIPAGRQGQQKDPAGSPLSQYSSPPTPMEVTSQSI